METLFNREKTIKTSGHGTDGDGNSKMGLRNCPMLSE